MYKILTNFDQWRKGYTYESKLSEILALLKFCPWSSIFKESLLLWHINLVHFEGDSFVLLKQNTYLCYSNGS